MHDIGMFDRSSPLDLSGFDNSGANFMPQFKPYISVTATPTPCFGDSQCQRDGSQHKR